jgi:hypothetical protein
MFVVPSLFVVFVHPLLGILIMIGSVVVFFLAVPSKRKVTHPQREVALSLAFFSACSTVPLWIVYWYYPEFQQSFSQVMFPKLELSVTGVLLFAASATLCILAGTVHRVENRLARLCTAISVVVLYTLWWIFFFKYWVVPPAVLLDYVVTVLFAAVMMLTISAIVLTYSKD